MTELVHFTVAHRGLHVYRVADPGWRWGWNRCLSFRKDRRGVKITIGIAAVTGRICWGITWRRA